MATGTDSPRDLQHPFGLFLGSLGRAVVPRLRKPLHHQYSRMTPAPVLWFQAITLALCVGISGTLVLASGGIHELALVGAFAALAAVSSAMPIRLHDDSFVNFYEFYLILSFIILQPSDALLVAVATGVWTMLIWRTSWLGALCNGGNILVSSLVTLPVIVGIGRALDPVAGPVLVLVAQIVAGIATFHFAFLLSKVPYLLFVPAKLRATLAPATWRDLRDDCATMLAAQAPTIIIAAVAAQVSPWLVVLTIAPFAHSWWSAERTAALAQERLRARTDPLTSLTNRWGLAEAFALRMTESPTAPAFILGDVDNFKNINDTLGHAAGDDVLARVAAAIHASTEGLDCVTARYGGEEFVVALFGADAAELVAQAEQLRQEVRLQLEEYGVTISLGATHWLGDEDTLDQAIGRADTAMYAAKGAGKNCTWVLEAAAGLPFPVLDQPNGALAEEHDAEAA